MTWRGRKGADINKGDINILLWSTSSIRERPVSMGRSAGRLPTEVRMSPSLVKYCHEYHDIKVSNQGIDAVSGGSNGGFISYGASVPWENRRCKEEGVVAERVGFEPTRELPPPTRFPVAPVRPLQHLSVTHDPILGSATNDSIERPGW